MLQGLMMNQHHHHQQQQQQQPAIVMDESLSNLTCAFGEASASTSSANPSAGNQLSAYPPPPLHQQQEQHHLQDYYTQQEDHPPPTQPPPSSKRKRSLPGNPDPDSEVIALSPKSLLATNRFMCEICNKGFQRDQNLQLHRRGHNLPWKLKQRPKDEVVKKKVYICPETSCVHHDPSRALGDLTGVKKHFCRKHGEKKWKCDKCSKRYAVQSDWKAHSKICGTREYRCDCGTLFSRRDSFITHRAFCDALAEETARSITANPLVILPQQQQQNNNNQSSSGGGSVSHQHLFSLQNPLMNTHDDHLHPPPPFSIKKENHHETHQPNHQSFNMIPPWLQQPPSSSTSTMMFSQELLQTLSRHDKNPNHPPSGPTTCTFPINGGPSLSPSSFPSPHPHMSATALLQKAAQFGATMSTNKSDPQQQQQQQCPPPAICDHQQDQLSTTNIGFFNQAPDNGGTTTFPSSSSSSFLHDLMMNSLSSFDGGGENEDLTRDFLGLGPLSHSEMLSFAGIGNVAGSGEDSAVAGNASSSSTSQHDQDLHNRSWQG